ncbi:MAG: response regulator [Deltaproteobacteria bacterium]|nr:response regulator [Deltaproteobacteria bacterium]
MLKSPRHPVVLFVDDEDLFRSTAVEALQRILPNYRFLQAANGVEALEQARDLQIDVVVTDVRMPKMGGTELLVELRKRGFRGRTLVISAFGDSRLERQVFDLGALIYLEKPLELTDLADSIRSAAEGDFSQVEGVTLAGFAQLLALERKTGRLRIACAGRRGDLYFQQGHLEDAQVGELRGDDAALEIFNWPEEAKLELLTDLSPRQQTVRLSLNHLLLEAMRLRDESAEYSEEASQAAAVGAPPQACLKEVAINSSTKTAMQIAMKISGALGIALVDSDKGENLAQAGGGEGLNLDLVGNCHTPMVRAKLDTMAKLKLDDNIEDILITLGRQYHIIRPLHRVANHFLFLAMDRDVANLALARLQLATIERGLQA